MDTTEQYQVNKYNYTCTACQGEDEPCKLTVVTKDKFHILPIACPYHHQALVKWVKENTK